MNTRYLIQAVLVLAGAVLLASTASFQFRGVNAIDFFGEEIACRDNIVAIGVPGRDGVDQDIGEVVIVDGSTGTLAGILPYPGGMPFAGDEFGTALQYIDDISGDDQPELLVGHPGVFSGIGQAHVYSSISSPPFLTLNGSSSFFSRFGEVIKAVGDLTADGRTEIAVSAPTRFVNTGDDGVVEIFDLESPSLPINTLNGADNETFGRSLAPLGDIDGVQDGTKYLAIGAPGADSNRGRVYIYNLSAGTLYATITNSDPLGGIGHRKGIAGLGDVDGDGIDDLLVGVRYTDDDNPQFNASRARVISGAGINVAPVDLCNITEPDLGNRFARSVANLGDIDGDGRIEFAIGATNTDGPQEAVGAVRIYKYIPGEGCVVLETLRGSTEGDELGVSFTENGCRFNADTAGDFAVGLGSDDNGFDAGGVNLYLGVQATPVPTATPTPPPASPGSRLSFRISETGLFRINIQYDFGDLNPADQNCNVTFFARSSTPQGRGRIYRIGTTNVTREREIFETTGFPRASKINGEKPAVNIIAYTECGGPETSSNVFSRFMNCGTGNGISADSWMAEFRRRFKSFTGQSVSAKGKRKAFKRKVRKKDRVARN